MIESCVPQMKWGLDELIIVGDGPLPPEAKAVIDQSVKFLAPHVRYIELPTRVGDFGCTPCDVGIKNARGDAAFFIGDDDLTAEGAFDAIRKAVEKDPERAHLFSMEHTLGRLGLSLACCAVSGQQIVVPLRYPHLIPKMADCPPEQIKISDWVFVSHVVEAFGEPVFHDEVIAILKDQNHGKFL